MEWDRERESKQEILEPRPFKQDGIQASERSDFFKDKAILVWKSESLTGQVMIISNKISWELTNKPVSIML